MVFSFLNLHFSYNACWISHCFYTMIIIKHFHCQFNARIFTVTFYFKSILMGIGTWDLMSFIHQLCRITCLKILKASLASSLLSHRTRATTMCCLDPMTTRKNRLWFPHTYRGLCLIRLHRTWRFHTICRGHNMSY